MVSFMDISLCVLHCDKIYFHIASPCNIKCVHFICDMIMNMKCCETKSSKCILYASPCCSHTPSSNDPFLLLCLLSVLKDRNHFCWLWAVRIKWYRIYHIFLSGYGLTHSLGTLLIESTYLVEAWRWMYRMWLGGKFGYLSWLGLQYNKYLCILDHLQY